MRALPPRLPAQPAVALAVPMKTTPKTWSLTLPKRMLSWRWRLETGSFVFGKNFQRRTSDDGPHQGQGLRYQLTSQARKRDLLQSKYKNNWSWRTLVALMPKLMATRLRTHQRKKRVVDMNNRERRKRKRMSWRKVKRNRKMKVNRQRPQGIVIEPKVPDSCWHSVYSHQTISSDRAMGLFLQ